MMETSAETPFAPDELLEHINFVRNLARGLVRDENQVDDVVQQSFLRAIKSPPRHRANVRSWLAVVVRNVVYRDADKKRLAQDTRWGVAESDHETDRATAAADRASEQADFQRSMSTAVHELDEPFRTVVVMRYFEELSTDEIAERLGVPRETVRSRQRRGLERLRKRLGDEDVESGGNWRVTALGLLGEDFPVGEAGSIGLGWIASAALMVPLVILGGAWWVTSGDQDGSNSESAIDAPSEPVTQDSQAHAADDVSTDAREVLGTPLDDHVAQLIRAKVLTAEGNEPISGARVVIARQVNGRWTGLVSSTDVDGVCTGELFEDVELPVEDRLAEWLGPDLPSSFAVVRAPGRAPLRISPLPGSPVKVTRSANDRRDQISDDAQSASAVALTSDSDESVQNGDSIQSASFAELWDLGNLRLALGVPVRGVVVQVPSGEPAGGAQLWLSDDGNQAPPVLRAVPVGRCNLDGSFLLEELIAPNSITPYTWTMFAELDGKLGWCDLLVDPLASEAVVVLNLGPYATLDVEVIDFDGTPAQGAKLHLLPLHPPWLPRRVFELPEFSPQVALSNPFRAETDARGQAAFEKIPGRDLTLSMMLSVDPWGGGLGGPYRVMVEMPGREPLIGEPFRLPHGVRVAQVMRLADLVGAPARGRVRGARDGRVLRDAWVRVELSGREIAVDEQGEFALDPRGPRQIKIGAPGYLTASFDWTPTEEEPRTCFLRERLELTGRVVDPEGRPIENIRLRAEGTTADLRGPTCETDAGGLFALEGLYAGSWRVTVELPADSLWRSPVPLRIDAGLDPVEIALERDDRPGREVRFSVLDARGAGTLLAVDADLAWLGPGGAPAKALPHLEGGVIRFDNVRLGSWRLWVRVPSRGAAMLDFEVTPGTDPLELQVYSGSWCHIKGHVEGHAEAGSQANWKVASVFIGPQAPRRWPGLREEHGSAGIRRKLDEDGNFHMENVQAGSYRIELIADGWSAATVVSAVADEPAQVVLIAERTGELILRGALPVPTGLSLMLSGGAGAGVWRWLEPEIVGGGWEARRGLPAGEQSWALGLRGPPGDKRPLPPAHPLASGTLHIEVGGSHEVEVELTR